jgi:16S rRNA (cytidine1402-2'-O)-methyltransferase
MLYLFPTPLSDNPWQESIPLEAVEVVKACNLFVVENLKTSRRFLRSMISDFDIDGSTFIELNEHTPDEEYIEIVQTIKDRNTVMLSEAGLPGIADPGGELVALCHDWDIPVKPITGPSSIVMALISSGLNGQQFTFHGYLPVDKRERQVFIKQMVRNIRETGYTQIFIETPYRNTVLFEDILHHAPVELRLCVAIDITGKNECIKTRSIGSWKSTSKPSMHKIPAVFCLGA